MVLFAAAGKMVGSYLLFFLGDRMKNTDRFQRLVARHRILRVAVERSERFVRRYVVFAVFLLLLVSILWGMERSHGEELALALSLVGTYIALHIGVIFAVVGQLMRAQGQD